MEFRVLGPLEVVDGASAIDLGRPKQRALLGLLLLRPGQSLPADRLVDELWRERPPRQAVASLHAYVSNLRRALEPGRPRGEPPRVLVRRGGGYAAHVEPARLDAARFERAVARAGAAAREGDHETAQRLFGAALAEWRGEPLADLAGELEPLPEVARLVELRLAAVEGSFESALALGRHAELVADLEACTKEHPLRERLRGHLALALYRSGRQADALDRLRQGRELLADELGLTAGPALRELEQRILQHDPALRWEPPAEPLDLRAPAPADGLVGREQQLAALRGAWTQAADGRGSVALITGEPGIGKTALAEAFARQVAAGSGRVLWGRSFEGGGAPPFWPWLQLLDAAVAELDDGPLCTVAGTHLKDLARMVPAVAERLRLDPVPVGDAAEARFRQYEAVTRFLVRVASTQPLAVVLEDVHAADVPSLELLGFIARHVGDAPVLLVVTCRDPGFHRAPALEELFARLTHDAPLLRVPLEGLTRDDVAKLFARRCDVPPTEEVARLLHERTDGNPFYLCELLREGPGAPGLPDDTPAGVRSVVERRLAALPAAVVEVLETAAVIGREFDLPTVATAHGAPPADVLERLDLAVGERLVVEQDRAAASYRFTHALVHERLYARLPPSRRTRLHAAVAEALGTIWGAGRASEIAHHFEHAAALGLAGPAVDAAVAAADAARHLLAFEQAEDHLRRALEVLRRFGDRDGRELTVQARLTTLLLETHGYSAPGLGVAAGRVRELARSGDRRRAPEVAGVLWALWTFRTVRAEFAAALRAADELARTRVAPAEVVRAATLHARGVTLWHLGRLDESADALEAAIGVLDAIDPLDLDRAGLAHLPAHARLQTAHPLTLLGRAEDAELHVLAAAASTDRERHPYRHAFAAMFMGWLAALREEPGPAMEWLEDAARTCEELGFRQLAAINAAPLGWARAMCGDASAGVATLEGAIAGMDATGAKMLRHWHLGLLGEALLSAGRTDDAMAAIEQGLVMSRGTGEAFHCAELLRLRGGLLLDRGERDAGRADLEAARTLADRQRAVLLLRRAEATLAAA